MLKCRRSSVPLQGRTRCRLFLLLAPLGVVAANFQNSSEIWEDLFKHLQIPARSSSAHFLTYFAICLQLWSISYAHFAKAIPGWIQFPEFVSVFFSYFAISVFKLKSNYSIAEYQIVGLTVFCKLSACSSRATHSFCTKNLNFEMRCLNDKLCQAYKKVKYRESRVKLWCKRCKRAYNKHQSIYYVYKFHWTV